VGSLDEVVVERVGEIARTEVDVFAKRFELGASRDGSAEAVGIVRSRAREAP
jgi:hypothetical protein